MHAYATPACPHVLHHVQKEETSGTSPPPGSVRNIDFIWKTASCVETMKFLRHILQAFVNHTFLRLLGWFWSVSGSRGVPW